MFLNTCLTLGTELRAGEGFRAAFCGGPSQGRASLWGERAKSMCQGLFPRWHRGGCEGGTPGSFSRQMSKRGPQDTEQQQLERLEW